MPLQARRRRKMWFVIDVVPKGILRINVLKKWRRRKTKNKARTYWQIEMKNMFTVLCLWVVKLASRFGMSNRNKNGAIKGNRLFDLVWYMWYHVLCLLQQKTELTDRLWFIWKILKIEWTGIKKAKLTKREKSPNTNDKNVTKNDQYEDSDYIPNEDDIMQNNDLETSKTAFLNGFLRKQVSMEIPECYIRDNVGAVMVLKLNIYGLKQSSRAWKERVNYFLSELRYKKLKL